jgi:hypothetical protein
VGRATYTVLVISIGAMIAFLMLLVLGAYIFEGEASISIGLLWYYSLPISLLCGWLIGRYTYAWYGQLNSVLRQASALLVLGLVMAIVSPVLTYAVLLLPALVS